MQQSAIKMNKVNKNGKKGIKVSRFPDFIILQQTQRCG